MREFVWSALGAAQAVTVPEDWEIGQGRQAPEVQQLFLLELAFVTHRNSLHAS